MVAPSALFLPLATAHIPACNESHAEYLRTPTTCFVNAQRTLAATSLLQSYQIYFSTSSNYVAPEDDHRLSERVAPSRILGRTPCWNSIRFRK